MATVWAYRVGAFTENPESGWSHTINFNSLEDLVNKLKKAGLQGRVQKLAIVAHGDRPGNVLMDGKNAQSPATFSVLQSYLTNSGMLDFVACIAGGGDVGTKFLQAVSTVLVGRVVVGYIVWGFTDNSFGAASDPGNIQASTGGQRPAPGTPRISPWSQWAKWAYRGTIVRLPVAEQNLNPGRRCANPRCPGHAAPNQHCKGTSWITDLALQHYKP